jgi:hypothetical protein
VQFLGLLPEREVDHALDRHRFAYTAEWSSRSRYRSWCSDAVYRRSPTDRLGHHAADRRDEWIDLDWVERTDSWHDAHSLLAILE